MGEHPIQGMMATAMQSIKEMVDVNTIVGTPVETKDGTVIIPISKVSFGFAAGGSDIPAKKDYKDANNFGGGSGAGVSIQPVAFMVVAENQIKLLPVNTSENPLDKIVDYIPDAVEKITNLIKSKSKDKDHIEISMD
ncbi:MAG: GerW family sporulation protein [Clostridia bacterium]|nr:GerW family sporulation protein [Clostridia bacterium]